MAMSPKITVTGIESIKAVEKVLNYSFKNKRLLEEALTHSSCNESASYQRLEFVGDAVLGLAFANFVYLAYPTVDQGILSLLRAANISTEKLALVAVRHRLYRFVNHNALALDAKVLQGEIELEQVKTDDQVADIFTKGLSGPKFEKFRSQLGMISRLTLRESSR